MEERGTTGETQWRTGEMGAPGEAGWRRRGEGGNRGVDCSQLVEKGKSRESLHKGAFEAVVAHGPATEHKRQRRGTMAKGLTRGNT